MRRKSTAVLLALMLSVSVLTTGCGISSTSSASAENIPETSIEFVMNDNMQPVIYTKKVDGDTAYFTIDGIEEKVRFLAVDTPETVKEGTPVEPYGPEASSYTDMRLSDAQEIYIEWDDNSEQTDAYGRYLGWIWVDGSLLEEELVRLGYAEVAYIYGDYKYADELYNVQDIAKQEELGIWS